MNSIEPPWDLYRSFLAVFDEGSLSRAARTFALTQPTLARHIEELEASLGGAPLFTRSPRGLLPTDAAHALEPHARTMASAAAALIRTASGSIDAIDGAVRITASDVIGVEVLPGILGALRAKHPKLSLEILTSNQPADLLRREADIAIRMVQPKQSALVAKRVGDVMLGMHAHRDYIKRHGAPKSLDDVEGHALIGYDRETIGVQALRTLGLKLTRDQFAYRTDNDLAQLNLLRSGAGIGICQIGLAKRDKNLVRILPDTFSFPLATWITMHEDLRGSARMRAVFDHLVEAMSTYARDI
ncbi:MAG: LysR family transcriptional regulator [Hyphomonadaceae bacterium JAD_PAG50586_4]|nr:MAG: LysR family transcriptional regulator [Hyphomonadaceae bacterium JAD_PAG50586_4]